MFFETPIINQPFWDLNLSRFIKRASSAMLTTIRSIFAGGERERISEAVQRIDAHTQRDIGLSRLNCAGFLTAPNE